MRIVAVYSIKGGVGKTATAVNLAYASASEFARTLLWDLDPQGASTYYFRVKAKVKGGISRILHRRRHIDRYIRATDYPLLDLLPADASYRYADLVLDELKKPTRGLKKVLKPLADEYDYLILDCPPSMSLLSESVFEAVEALIVPVIPTTLSLRTLDQLTEFCRQQHIAHLRMLPFFSMADRRKNLHRSIMQELPQKRPGMLDTQIPYASVVEQMGVHRAPVATYAASNEVADCYSALWAEIRQRLLTEPRRDAAAEANPTT